MREEESRTEERRKQVFKSELERIWVGLGNEEYEKFRRGDKT